MKNIKNTKFQGKTTVIDSRANDVKWGSTFSETLRRGLDSVNGMIKRNLGLSWVNLFNKIGRPIVGTSKSWIRVYKHYGKFIYKLYKHGGVKYVVIYLKASSVLLQQAVGGDIAVSTRPLNAAVARTRGGLPKVIPALMRKRIMDKEVRVVKLWLTLFNLYRVLEFPGKLKLSTITDPGVALSEELILSFRTFLNTLFLLMAQKYVSVKNFSGSAPAETLKAKPFLISKASPVISKQDKEGRDEKSWSSTSPWSVLKSAYLLRTDPILMPVFTKWCDLTGNGWAVRKIWAWSDPLTSQISDYYKSKPVGYVPGGGSLGKVGFKEEAAGKVRVFAMVDCWTQWILRPLHDAIFHILREIPQDGTFDQTQPVHLLLEEMDKRDINSVFSYDLSAATDRLPIAIQELVLTKLIGKTLAGLWCDLLVHRGYEAYNKQYKVRTTLYYAVGQPMGALSSWAMLALTHHVLVQWASYRVLNRKGENRPVKWFNLYAILGDDIVIADSSVAKEYLKIMAQLGVEISLAKSLVSNNRTLEFAKRFFIPQDATPVPFKELLCAERNSSALVEYARRFNLELPDVLATMGFGYKALAKLDTDLVGGTMGLRMRRILVMLTAPDGVYARSLREWITMRSIVTSQDISHWDRLLKSYTSTEFPILLRRVKQLQSKITQYQAPESRYGWSTLKHTPSRPAPWNTPFFGEGENPAAIIWLEKITLNFSHILKVTVSHLPWVKAYFPKVVHNLPMEVFWDMVDTIYSEGYLDRVRKANTLMYLIQRLARESAKADFGPDKLVSLYFSLWSEAPTKDLDLWDVFERIWNQIEELDDDLSLFPTDKHVPIKFRKDEGSYLDPIAKRAAKWMRLNRVSRKVPETQVQHSDKLDRKSNNPSK